MREVSLERRRAGSNQEDIAASSWTPRAARPYGTVRHGTFTNDRVARILSRILSSLLSSPHRARERRISVEYLCVHVRVYARDSACA